MTVTSKAKRKEPARKGKASGQPQERSVTIPFPDTDNEDEANRILAKDVPDWEKLDKDERVELLRLIRAYRKRGDPAKVKLTRKPAGGWSIAPVGKSEMLALLKLYETFSANSIDPVNARANELLKYLGSVGADNEARYNAALSFIESMKPQDQAEALLLVQMYCTHDAAIRALSQLGSAEWVPTAQTFGNLATKLLGTSQRQMETLSRMRRGGEQVVKHVHVDNRGGQAVIAENLNQGGGPTKNEDQCHGAGIAGSGPALLGHDAQGNGVPIPSRKGAEAVQDARRDESWRA
ncbi:hypothetical protein MKP08_07515 [Erythrobacter sp. LQ02-29]|uniref:hypothetical protein n=1 Tax=Erythrobacter sp. LQ02-29 TaxID=2920384 RepID=UPI001F4DFF0B|nr:hypothetical protein [Erythrobacter sp. LQ02-29]MCP9222590.1 hypothetical protein [Erythrobacter sp. LQ02-29]